MRARQRIPRRAGREGGMQGAREGCRDAAREVPQGPAPPQPPRGAGRERAAPGGVGETPEHGGSEWEKRRRWSGGGLMTETLSEAGNGHVTVSLNGAVPGRDGGEAMEGRGFGYRLSVRWKSLPGQGPGGVETLHGRSRISPGLFD